VNESQAVIAATPSHGYVSVAAGAFVPHSDTCAHTGDGYFVATDGGACYFHIYAVTSRCTHNPAQRKRVWLSGETGYATLPRVHNQTNSTNEMAVAWLSDECDTIETTAIDYSVVDNSQCAYYLTWYVSDQVLVVLHQRVGDGADARDVCKERSCREAARLGSLRIVLSLGKSIQYEVGYEVMHSPASPACDLVQ
jgi:hypothetical protein